LPIFIHLPLPSPSLLWNFGEEIAGGTMDVKCDEQRGALTLARVRGRKYALRISGVLFASFIGLSFLPFLMGWLGYIYFALIAITDLVVFYLVFRLLRSKTIEEG
jgi:geranylgeranylglycerol-phosphate geranylgeranyltransferase